MAENIFCVSQSKGLEFLNGNVDCISCGSPIPNVDIRLIDGQIHVKSPYSLNSYIGGIQLNLVDGYYPTGDIGVVSNVDLAVTGRIGDILNIAGKKFMLNDVDEVINSVDLSIKGRAASLADYDDVLNIERLLILVEREDFYVSGNLAELSLLIKSSIEIDNIKLDFVPKDFISKTSSGKINRKKTLFDYRKRATDVLKSATVVTSLKEEVLRVCPRAKFDLPIDIALDSLSITILQMLLADRELPYDPSKSLLYYFDLENQSISVEASSHSVNSTDTDNVIYIVVINEQSHVKNITEEDIA